MNRVKSQDFDAMQLLLAQNNLDVNATDIRRQTALFGAVSNDDDKPTLRVVQFFLARRDVDVNIRDIDDYAPLYHAVCSGQPDVVQLLLTRQDLEISIEDGEEGILFSLAEDKRDKTEEEEFDAYDRIIGLLRSYIQKKSSNTTSANVMQQDPQRQGHTDDNGPQITDNVQAIQEQTPDLAVGGFP